MMFQKVKEKQNFSGKVLEYNQRQVLVLYGQLLLLIPIVVIPYTPVTNTLLQVGFHYINDRKN